MIQKAVDISNKKDERHYLFYLLIEMCFIIELGGSDICPVDELERNFVKSLARLRVLVDVP